MTSRLGVLRAWLLLLTAGASLQVPLASAQNPLRGQLRPDAHGRHAESQPARTLQEPTSPPARLSSAAAAADDGAWMPILPEAHANTPAIYDPVRDRMVVFWNDWRGINHVWVLSLDGTPTWSQVGPVGPPPANGQTAIYDPVRDRMVVFADGGAWALSLAGSPTWSQLSPVGTTPLVHSAIYDPVRDRMIVYGGGSDLWALSLAGSPSWTVFTPGGTPPSSAKGFTSVYDPPRDRIIVYGGEGEVWTISLAGSPIWTEFTPGGTVPSVGSTYRAIHDPVRDRMLVFWGNGEYGPLRVWALSLAGSPTWTELPPLSQGRTGFSVIYDPVRGRVAVCGGTNVYDIDLNDVWTLSLAETPNWSRLVPNTALWGHRAIYDPTRSRMLVFGGFPPLNDEPYTLALSLEGSPALTEFTAVGTPPSVNDEHSAIYDPVRDRVIVYGGGSDVWALSLAGSPSWTVFTPGGTPPPSAKGFTSVYEPLRDRMIVYGGGSDVWALSLAGSPSWTVFTPGGTPPSSATSFTSVYDPLRDRMIVYGGYDSSYEPLNDVWELRLTGSPTWARLTPTGTLPAPRWGHTAIYDPVRDRMIVYGGALSTGDPLHDVWALSFAGSASWRQLNPGGGVPFGQSQHSAVYDPVHDRMVVFAGWIYWGPSSDVEELVWGTPLLPPPALTAEAGPASITLRWTPSLSENVVGYRISYGPVGESVRYSGEHAAEGPSGIEVPASQTSLTLTCLPDSLFHLVVQAVGGEGGRSGWSQEVLAQPQRVGGLLALTPSSLGSLSQGRWVSAVLEPSSGFTADQVVVESLRLNEVLAPERAVLGDGNENGVRDLALKFSREQLVALLPQGEQAEVRVTGWLLGCRDTLSCVVRDTIRLIQPRVTHPVAGVQVAASSMVEIAWTLPSELAVDSVLVRVSVDNQRAWVVAGRVPAGRSVCEWRAPGWAAESCYVAVVACQGGEEGGVGYGGPFRVSAPVAVVQPTERFGLEGARPHPFRAGGVIAFGVAQAGVVSLRVFDLRGRLVGTLVDGPVPAGRHEVAWDAHGVAAGVYFVQLRSGLESEQRRLVVLGE
jgi:galactose oxidase-like protein/fibronectin type III domain protein